MLCHTTALTHCSVRRVSPSAAGVAGYRVPSMERVCCLPWRSVASWSGERSGVDAVTVALYIYIYICNGVEWSKDRTQAAESIKWRPQ